MSAEVGPRSCREPRGRDGAWILALALMLFPDAVQRGAHKGVYALMSYVLHRAREKYSGAAPPVRTSPAASNGGSPFEGAGRT